MDTETRYNLALDYLYSYVDYSLKKADQLAAANFNLDRMRALMAKLGDPQNSYPVIHVAGTKGKGSTSALCAAALMASGRKTGLYTSPHLQDYAERIQLDGQPIPHDILADLVDEMKPAVESIPALTTFEITTALGFLYFARAHADAAVIEVGLGGRLDATNIVTPRVSIITSLSYDHMAVLGETLAKIAGEKAGIIKPGIPVVSSPQKPEALEVLVNVAAGRNSPLTLVGLDALYQAGQRSLEGQEFEAWNPGLPHQTFKTPLLGDHQVQNAVTAWAALKASGLDLDDSHIRAGFASMKWPCRFEIASRENPTLIFDSAHNEDSFEKLTNTIQTYFPGRSVILILGISEDKHLFEMLSAMEGIISRLIITRANHPRALEMEKIVETAKKVTGRYETAAPVETALDRALEVARETGDIILSAGSMFVTAEVKTAWQKRNSTK